MHKGNAKWKRYNMNKKYTLKGANGLYFVNGKGFTASCVKEASQLTNEQVKCTDGLGFIGTSEEIKSVVSFACNYVRPEDVQGDGSIRKNTNNPSRRRFATRAEANQHGSRFNVRIAKQGDKPGSAGHIGFYVIETLDAVNATVNWESGLTNPL